MSEEIISLLWFGLFSILFVLAGVRKGFFKYPSTPWIVPLRLFHLLGAFLIYFITSSFAAKIALSLFKKEIFSHYLSFSNWLNFIVSFSVFLLLFIYMKCLPKQISKGILLRSTPHSFKEDIASAFYAWLISFPLVLFFSKALEMLVIKVFSVPQLPDQVAVKFLKLTFDHPLHFGLAVVTIVILAPLVEETLFRGFLQTYIRQYVGSRTAIFLSSASFSLFHYAAGQELSNFSLIPSLFVLALFLGFLYEKRGSLLSPLALHAMFNFLNVVNLYLFGGFTTGL